jgi:membrane associated rhomboid family serine protease
MLENRDYMRDRESRPALTLTVKLIIAMVIIFAVQCFWDVYVKQWQPVEYWLALHQDCLRSGKVWQLITFQFLHFDFWHLLWNMIALWFFGSYCEQILGKSRYLTALLLTGTVGGLLQATLMRFFPTQFGLSVVGASAGVSGALAIFALLEQQSTIRLWCVLPVRAIWFLYALTGISLFFTLVPTPREMGVAHPAHLGGILAGIAWVKLGWHQDYIRLPWERWVDAWRERRSRRPVRLPAPSPVMASAVSKNVAAARKESRPTPSGPTEFISKEVDPILDKIAAHGIHSLTDEEKKILANAGSKIAKR